MAKKKPAPVASIKHKDKRPNIPTRELRGFVEEAENKPMTSTFAGLLYARDPSLDPQLVWKGKDELDRSELTVPCVPIYIQEKIHPHAIIDDIAIAEVKGVDVYDPTTGEIRNSSVDDIACWFIDTNYNEESFFVRHAYFLGADEPYEKLKRALRAEIDESAWAALYSAKSVPFDMPTTGKIAIKVINHYGDEVLKVFPVEMAKKRK